MNFKNIYKLYGVNKWLGVNYSLFMTIRILGFIMAAVKLGFIMH